MAARRMVILLLVSVAAASFSYLNAFVSSDELNLLQDPDGWEYTKIVTENGFPTDHPCFDGTPHPQECRGTLTLGSDERFVKKIYIEGQPDTRTGRYKIDGERADLLRRVRHPGWSVQDDARQSREDAYPRTRERADGSDARKGVSQPQ